jgi:hypothetical protein
MGALISSETPVLIRATRRNIPETPFFIVHTWLRYYATSRKVVGSITDEATTFSTDLIVPAALWFWRQISLGEEYDESSLR